MPKWVKTHGRDMLMEENKPTQPDINDWRIAKSIFVAEDLKLQKSMRLTITVHMYFIINNYLLKC